ncbi:glycosyltransferase family 4 protein [Vibrio superstes]|uniref:Glycosyl transferase family 1 domain-containing protein n=1 Tax=Vibrio superstes NBRC 103154 TaxID=1219062 RepID=A0A511QLW5_9VIBR|nr:glycosyltransferase family 4 protein [Vibrio superstes]GEM78167.1 hypothetical protein VSU01S_04120 [Vibrio superstes NBRC 103154]
MKILICNKNLKKLHTGTSRNVYEQIRYFVSKGFEVHIAAESLDLESLKLFGAIPHKTLRLPWLSGYKRRAFFSKQCDKIKEKIKPRLTIGHGDYQNPDIHCIHNNVHLAYEKIHKKSIPFNNEIYKIHTPIFEDKKFKHIIANSNLAKSDLVSRFNISNSNITVVYPAVNEKKFHKKSESTRKNTRESLHIESNEFLVGLITSGDFNKRGVDIFFNALLSIRKENIKRIKVLLIGEKSIPKDYLSIIEGSEVEKKIVLLPIQDNIEDYFNALDVFILPSRIEEFGRVVAEAMACGCPIITNSDVGSSELATGLAKEFIYSNENTSVISKLIEEIMMNPQISNELSKLSLVNVDFILEKNIYSEFDTVFNTYIKQ